MSDQDTNLSGRSIKGYELRELIGTGGFADVYRAYQPAVGREVAVKIILTQYANHPDFIRRFEAEAQLIARLEHIHIVPLFDYWRDPDGAYLVMRWLRGGSLRDLLDQRLPLELSFIQKVLDQISAALEIAHRSGVIHQDIKPDNVLLDDARNAFLADFGIAKNLFDVHPVDDDDLGFGTPAYVSPEQILRHQITQRSDVYSLGIMLYELLTGQKPFTASDQTTLLQKHVQEPLPSLQARRAELPRQLSLVLWRACAKSADARYASALDLAADFRAALPESTIQVISSEHGFSPAQTPIDDALMSKTTQLQVGDTLLVQPVVETQNPFKGLRPFHEADAADFFGRTSLVEHLLNVFGGEARFLAVLGPSGSGKSSLVRAGLIPALRRGMLPDSEKWYIAQMTPAPDPFKALESALLQVAVGAPASLLDWLRADESGLLHTVKRIIPLHDAQIVLFIDQFEELFTQIEDEDERRLFLENLYNAATDSESPLRIIVTLRADFYDRPLLYPGFSTLMKANTEVVLPLTPGELEQTIIGPAERVGLHIERGLVPSIVTDVIQQPGALPLLQYALTELFEQRTNNTLTLAAYQAIGGVAGALARRADSLYNGLDSQRQAAARRLFLQIATTHNGLEDSRRRVTQGSLLASAPDRELMAEVIDLFGNYRLLAFDREPETRAPTVEIAHEALIRQWDQLREWLQINRDELRTYRQLVAATREWLRSERDPSFLATGARLGQFSALQESDTVAFSPDQTAYLEASAALRQRTINRLRLFVAVLALGLLLVSGLALFAIDRQQQARRAEAIAIEERDRADEQARISRSRELAVTAMTSDQQDVALLISLEALQAAKTFEARNSLLTALQEEPRVYSFLNGHEDGVRALVFDPAGDLLATAGQDTLIHLWDMKTLQPAREPLAGHNDWINALAYAPDGTYLVSASADGTVRRWDTATGIEIDAPLVTGTDLWGVAISPDGTQIAASSADGHIFRWDAVTGEQISVPLASHNGLVYSIAFSPDGSLLASAGDDNAVRLWDLDHDDPEGRVAAIHDNWALSVAFSPDGLLLASGGADNAVVLWDIPENRVIRRIENAHENWIRHLTFSPTGTTLVSTGADGVIRVWDTQTGTESSQALSGHQAAVWSAAFNPSGDLLAAGNVAGGVILWDVAGHHTLDLQLGRHQAAVYAVAASSDGRYVISGGGDPTSTSASGDNMLRIWAADAEQGEAALAILEGHDGPVTDIAISPDGETFASSGAEGSVLIWNMDTRSHDTIFIGGSGSINAVRFSPESGSIAAAADDGTVTIWSGTNGERRLLQAGEQRLFSLAYSPDGELLATGSDSAITLWHVQSGEQLDVKLDAHYDAVTTLNFSPDGRLLVSGSRDGTLILWDTSNWEITLGPLVAHTNWVMDAAFSPDGALLASGSRDGSIILWDVESGRVLGHPLMGSSPDWIRSVDFSPDGSRLFAGSGNGTVTRWDVSLLSWQQRACRIANRALTADEWGQYMDDMSYHQTCN